ncbi:Chitinase 1 [Apophysomyces sp. BC1034]|nr:Chitinase 1 [Apophysomyces sp. BC1015]KAG0180295.1 Chitinase 1 [Apophysomyces sp. BC1021]KAG0194807.1 Chitinase 1 [Apophysomyces sp. BC1034]
MYVYRLPWLLLITLVSARVSQASIFSDYIHGIEHLLSDIFGKIFGSTQTPPLKNPFQKNGTNLVLYWGQGSREEKRLAYYCEKGSAGIIIIAFIADYTGGLRKSPVLNLSSHCDNVEHCPEVAADIKVCQKRGIKVLLSLGGADGPYHTQKWDPELLAWWVWNKFLGGNDRTLKRPFGDVILDGIDYDPEGTSGQGYDHHIDTLRKLFKTYYPSREFLVTAAPQCPDLETYPYNAVYNLLHPNPRYDAYPDMVFVQFYNNYCSASEYGRVGLFNFDEWDAWARKHGNITVYLGVLAKDNNMDTGYVNYNALTHILDSIQYKPSFGGVMMWDARYAYDNPVANLHGIQYGQAAAEYLRQLMLKRGKGGHMNYI